MNADKLMETIKGTVVPYRYDFYAEDINAIHSAAKDDAELMGWCFRFGFLQGRKAERAEAKKKAQEKSRREMEKEAPGYGLLMAMARKHRSDEQYVKMMGGHALMLEKVLARKREANPHD